MTDLDTKSPHFTGAIRGYDRAQVDEYVGYLQRLVAAAGDRACDAETELIFDEHAAIGPRIAEIFALAEAEARELHERITRQTDDLGSAARAEARAIIEGAEKSAATITERAERDHVVMFAELEQERERIRSEVTVLELRKAEAIGELHRLRELLGEAAGVVGSTTNFHGPASAPAQLIGGSDETAELPALAVDTREP
ncbi:MAG: hypothetical protein ACRDLT_17510 [Solirubrobacteraceae bacterium]